MSDQNPRNNAANTRRGRPFQMGNPGRPRGARNRVTQAVELLLEGEADALTRTAIDRAKSGDVTALRLCLDRIAPPRKGRPIAIELPALKAPRDAVSMLAAIVNAVSSGELSPEEAGALAGVVDHYVKAAEFHDVLTRLETLEKRLVEGGTNR
jgi:hypothetical protein